VSTALAKGKTMKVFISSPLDDLREHRQEIALQCTPFKFQLTMMEAFPPDQTSAKEFCKKKIKGHDLFILVLRAKYGSKPPGEQKSYTKIEYDTAQSLKIETLVFLAEPRSFSGADLSTDPEDYKSLMQWKDKLVNRHACKFFDTSKDLGLLVADSLRDRVGQKKESHQYQKSSKPVYETLWDEEVISEFLMMIDNTYLRNELQDHLDHVRQIGFEDADNEDRFISLRRFFYSKVKKYRKQLLVVAREFNSKRERTTTSVLICHELGRVFIEGREGEAAYEILYSLEEDLTTLSESITNILKSRIYDSIGEAARFADRYKVAKRLYKAALGLYKNNYFSIKHQGTICRIENDFPKALEYFNKGGKIGGQSLNSEL
jgi:hypothetical protein